MEFRKTRDRLLFAACAVTVCWGLMQRPGGELVDALNSGAVEPGLISETLDATDLGRIPPIPLNSDAVYYDNGGDRHVRPASASAIAALSLATQVIGQQAGFSITKVTQGEYEWSTNEVNINPLLIPLLSSERTVKISGTGTVKKNDLEVSVDGLPGQVTEQDDTEGWSVTLILPDKLTKQRVEVKRAPQTQPTTIFLRLPGTEPQKRPKITQASSNVYAEPLPIASAPKVYDRYLRVKGESVELGTELLFYVFKVAGAKRGFWGAAVVENPPVKIEPNATWDTELRLPHIPEVGEKYQLVVLATSRDGQQHVVSQQFEDTSRVLTLDGTNDDLLDAVPDFKVVKIGGDVLPGEVAVFGTRTITVKGDTPDDSATNSIDSRVAIFLQGNSKPIGFSTQKPDNNGWSADITFTTDGKFQLEAATVLGNTVGKRSKTIEARIGTRPPRVVSVEPTNLSFSPQGRTIKVNFDPQVKVKASSVTATEDTSGQTDAAGPFVMTGSNGSTITLPAATFNANENSATIRFAAVIPADIYTFKVTRTVTNEFGQALEEEFSTQLIMPVGADQPTVSRGITGTTGPNVEFSEYTEPRDFIDGFNPSDHVETRVSRLYYFRDAHRVAQIVNRDAKSYNRAAVDMQQQLADKSRQLADQATDDRRAKERKAVEAAKKTREAERELQQAEQSAQRAAQQAATAAQDQQRADAASRDGRLDPKVRDAAKADAANFQALARQYEDVAAAARRRADAATARVQHLREEEAQASEEGHAATAVEDRARENQFRREVAAAHADPDTYAPGKPRSKDPVRQVSVSVIGEGLIQLRGPIKGINVIRTMINQIDAPVGQVRVGVHTVQINGEKGDRMEVVAGKIQRYIDHSRFLTLQSAEMLRKAIVQVAAQRAMELGNVPGLTQQERDRSYLYSFFGEDFIHELEAMDSEFLGTGNKLLSIHSMDSTSLASAMFIMALAKNTTRMQILQTFEGMMLGELPMAEQNYFEAGLTCNGKEKLFGKYCKPEEFQMLSENARFQSIRGMFNVEIAEDDTMTPFQREFVRLAQIFKSRLIVEMELKQRIMERAVIEERLGDREKDLKDARVMEDAANDKKKKARDAVRDAQKGTLAATRGLLVVVQSSQRQASESEQAARQSRDLISAKAERMVEFIVGRMEVTYRTGIAAFERDFKTTLDEERNRILRPLENGESIGRRLFDLKDQLYVRRTPALPQPPAAAFSFQPDWPSPKGSVKLTFDGSGKIVFDAPDQDERSELESEIADLAEVASRIKEQLATYHLDHESQAKFTMANNLLTLVEANRKGDEINNSVRIRDVFDSYAAITESRTKRVSILYEELGDILAAIGRPDANLQQLYQNWLKLEQKIFAELNDEERKQSKQSFQNAQSSFQTLVESDLDYEFALREAEASRRPLDHKKFLDMLVDEMEDKYIELLEGTRAHTANIDAYIKRLITSLDDDFNTQFYYPTFRKVREASQLWDVQMGQVETTTVLANNRSFAKVSPQATMEFDLPKRDIVIAEAMNGAKAMMNDFGALAQDPTFLAMAQLNGGQPTSSPMAGATGGQATVRNVLPGLSTDTAESVMGQHGPGGSQFGAAMEALIPDPAIYKFETGTGWEIRPVIQPDGQALVFDFNYMYTTNIREPVRADEKHLGRVKRHFVDTDVQLSNFELREISRYTVALKASRTSRGVPLFEDIPVVGVLFRPLPSDESSLQQNIIMGQATIFPTVFDLMGLRWAPVVADLDPLRLSNDEFVVRNRRRALTNRVFDHSSSEVDKFLRIPDGERRMDLYRSQETIPSIHPNGYQGPGANLRDSQLQEGYDPTRRPESQFVPSESIEGSPHLRSRRRQPEPYEVPLFQPQAAPGGYDNSSFRRQTGSQTGIANVQYRAPVGDTRYPGQQAEYVTTQPGRPEPRSSSRMQRLPTVDVASPAFPGQVPRPVVR